MANSLSVYKIDKTCSEFCNGKSFSLDAQKTLDNWGDDVNAYFLPETRVSHLKIKFDILRPSAFAILADFWS